MPEGDSRLGPPWCILVSPRPTKATGARTRASRAPDVNPMRVAADLARRPTVLVDGLRRIIDRAWTAVLPSVVEDISPPIDHDRARENAARFRRHSAEVMVQRADGHQAR